MYADEKHSYLVILWANITSSWANMPRQNKRYMTEGSSFLTPYWSNTLSHTVLWSMLQPPALCYHSYTFQTNTGKILPNDSSRAKEKDLGVRIKIRAMNYRSQYLFYRKKNPHKTKLDLSAKANSQSHFATFLPSLSNIAFITQMNIFNNKNRGSTSCIEWHQVRSGYRLGRENVLEHFFRSVSLTSSCKPHRKSCIWLLAEWKHCWGYVHIEHWGLLCTLYCFRMVLYHSLVIIYIFCIYFFCGLGVFFVFLFPAHGYRS